MVATMMEPSPLTGHSRQQSRPLSTTTPSLSRRTGDKELLTHEDEIRLARTIRSAHSKREADMAKEALVAANLRLVASVAHKYRHRGVPVEDLLQEGAIGLIRAAERFDPERGYRFSTYAIWWIKQAILRAIGEQGRVIRLPENIASKLGRIAEARAELQDTLGRQPSDAELADALGLTEEKLCALMTRTAEPVSLDVPLGEDDSDSLQEVLTDHGAQDPLARAVQTDTREELLEALRVLTEREKAVIVMRFGLDGREPRTFDAIAAVLKVVPERARQIEGSALRKMRGVVCAP